MRKEGALIYRSIYDAARNLPDAQRLQFYDAVMGNRFDGAELRADDPVINAMLALLAPVFDKSDKRAEAGRRGGISTAEKAPKNSIGEDLVSPKMQQSESKPQAIKDKGLRIKDKGDSNTRFTPPTPDEVRQYAAEAGLQIDADAFCDFYESKGWKVGSDKMRSWKAACRNWSRRDQERKRPAAASERSSFHVMDQRLESYSGLVPSKYA